MMATNTLIKIQSLIENYGNNQPKELEQVLVKFQEEVVSLELISTSAVEELEDAMSLTRNWKISVALGLDVVFAIDRLMEHHDGVQAHYLSLMLRFIKELMDDGE